MVAGIGGLVIGHILWLIAISLAISTTAVERWVLIVVGRHRCAQRRRAARGLAAIISRSRMVWAAFLLCLPVSPLLFTLACSG